jgi:hypothetical protein
MNRSSAFCAGDGRSPREEYALGRDRRSELAHLRRSGVGRAVVQRGTGRQVPAAVGAGRRRRLINWRDDNAYARALLGILRRSVRDLGRRRPTWTQPLLIKCAHRATGITISVSRMSRLQPG